MGDGSKGRKARGWSRRLWMDGCSTGYWLLSLVLLFFLLYYILVRFCMEKRDRMDICDSLTHSFIVDIFIFIYYFL